MAHPAHGSLSSDDLVRRRTQKFNFCVPAYEKLRMRLLISIGIELHDYQSCNFDPNLSVSVDLCIRRRSMEAESVDSADF